MRSIRKSFHVSLTLSLVIKIDVLEMNGDPLVFFAGQPGGHHG